MKLKTLYIISTPINGDLQEMSPKAIQTLQEVPIIILEDFLVGKKTLDLLKIDYSQKTLLELNEHTEARNSQAIFDQIKEVSSSALISDAGTPLTADPGYTLIRTCINNQIGLRHIPAISSILSALVLSGFDLHKYDFVGFPPRETKDRKGFFYGLANNSRAMVILDTPYRFNKTIDELSHVFRKPRRVCICFDLGTPDQVIYRGTLREAREYYKDKPLKKKPFVIVVAKERE